MPKPVIATVMPKPVIATVTPKPAVATTKPVVVSSTSPRAPVQNTIASVVPKTTNGAAAARPEKSEAVALGVDDGWSASARPLPGLTPEMREEVRALIRAEIERGLTPLLEKQRQLEEQISGAAALPRAAVEEARPMAVAETPSALALPTPPVSIVAAPSPVQPVTVSVAPVVSWPPVSVPVRAEPKAPDGPIQTDFEIPTAIDGTRRQNLVGWLIVLAVVMAFAAIVAAAIVSQMGYKW
jgi:hypothetical protein